MVFGPSLTGLFFEAGAGGRVAAVDRHSNWPPAALQLPCAGDYLSPSLEAVAEIGATSIHVVGTSHTLQTLSDQLGIPCYTYSFDTLEDVMLSAEKIEELYPEADLSVYRETVQNELDSLYSRHSANSLTVMVVIYLEEDGAITLAGRGTFFADIVERAGCLLAAPEAGSYPAVSVEGVLSMDPDRILILAPGGDPGTIMRVWTSNGLPTEGVRILDGDYVLIPGARLPITIREMGNCLN